MHYFSVILFNLLAATAATAPFDITTSRESGAVSPRQDNPFLFRVRARLTFIWDMVYICTDPHWGGTCTKIERLKGYCINNGRSGAELSSFGPDQGFKCDLFRTIDCSGKSLHLEWPGTDDLAGWTDDVGSFSGLSECEWTAPSELGCLVDGPHLVREGYRISNVCQRIGADVDSSRALRLLYCFATGVFEGRPWEWCKCSSLNWSRASQSLELYMHSS
ncbi:hypothetical protein IWX90DRAFT_412223 [Phyllosticta citrichinensis]|uniref:Cyanovirin-N domain-containing protein n=1 Tax=Phyllosticta citrichinensis TaxID=1130410 RepID=A0ABR1Y412_9PEZI